MINLYHLEKFAVLREAIKRLSGDDPLLSYGGDSPSAGEFDRHLLRYNVNVLLLDMDLETEHYQPLTDCYNFCVQLQQHHPFIRVILHSPYAHSGWLEKFMGLGVMGFVSKNSKYGQLTAAIHSVHAGELFVCPVIIDQFSNFPEFLANRNIPLKMTYSIFTPREMEVLDLLSRGLSTRDIAASLFLSEKTIESHRKNLIDKAGVKNTVELIRFVSIRGLAVN